MKFLRSIMVMLVLTTGSSFSLKAQTETELQGIFLEVLEQINIEGEIDGDGDVQFKYGKYSYFLEVNENDPEFYRLVLPNIWPVGSELERLKVIKAVNEVNKSTKVVKAYMVNDNVWVAVEMFVGKPDSFISSFERQFTVIDDAVKMFVEEME